jgi:peptidoglycan/LPS O-acetylase OafA/YrhL
MAQHTLQKPRTTGTQRFDELEAYRGLAALCIIVFHTYQYSRQGQNLSTYVYEGTAFHSLFSGLHMSGVFFTLSGFLLFLPFVRAALSQEGQRSVRSFLIRRFVRILPLYYLALFTVWSWRFVDYPGQVTDLLLHMTFTHPFHPTYVFWTIGPTWSLAVEVHFYLFLAGFGPLLYWLCSKVARPQQRQMIILTFLGLFFVGSIAFKWWVLQNPQIATINYLYSLPAKFDVFALGMFLAFIVSLRGEQPLFGKNIARCLQLGGLTLLLVTISTSSLHPVAHLFHATAIGLGTILLMSSTTLGPRGSRLERALQLPALSFIGTISYGIFMLHEPLMIELGRHSLLISSMPEAFPTNALTLICISLLAATLSYYLIEQPFNELRHLFDRHGRFIERYRTSTIPSPTQPLPQPQRPPVQVKPATAQD